MQAGKPILIDGSGNVRFDIECKDLDHAKQEAKRLARKLEDEVYVYVPTVKFVPTEPKIEEEEVK